MIRTDFGRGDAVKRKGESKHIREAQSRGALNMADLYGMIPRPIPPTQQTAQSLYFLDLYGMTEVK